MTKADTLHVFMQQYSTFIFDSYAWNPQTGTVQLRYILKNDASEGFSTGEEVRFTETLTFPSPPPLDPSREDEFDRVLFALHLIGGVSYYKTCLPKNIEIRSGTISKEQAEFWNSVYENGLGEFFYKNDIDFEGLIRFPYEAVENGKWKMENSKETTPHFSSHTLVPVGGGKDSVVTMERLRAEKKDITLFRMGGHPLIDALAQTAGLPLLTIKRALAPELFALNEQGALNGHVPITAYLSFVTVLVSILYGFDDVAMSSERSANVGNVEFHGKEINHQWSKSLEFERMFQRYLRDFVTTAVTYGSPLREMTELQIVEQFTRYPQYFACTTSCNTNWRILGKKEFTTGSATGSWCGMCPKCAFVFALYAAFLPKASVLEIFGKNLFDDAALAPLYRELLGREGFKPFECVGTPEETKDAFERAHKKGEWDDTAMMTMFLTDR